MDTRTFMRKGEKITLAEETTGNKRTFTIISKDGAGASSVSYIASSGRKNGRLKEFYPSSHSFGGATVCERMGDNLLSTARATTKNRARFLEMIEDCLESYHALDDAKKEAKKGHNSFNTFIPTFEIYTGGDSAYIWTADNSGDFETFESYLARVHKSPSVNPAKTLYVILKTLYNLTECIKTLHSAGLIHSDIKPANFGFAIRDGRYLTEQVQLFDINSVYSVYTNFPTYTGTPGFMAPEVVCGNVTNQSDLYSIGAVLFNAIAVSDDERDIVYDDSYYTRLDEYVAESVLLGASPITSSPKVRSAVLKILKMCLAKELRNRVDNCDELKDELQRASVLLIPAQFNDMLDLGSELKIIDKELDRYNEADATFAIQSLLYNRPLYKAEGDTVRVLVAGFGVYGQQFADCCLQAGQIIDKKLEVIVLTRDKQGYKEEYLRIRPELEQFFEIDGKGDVSDESFGKITFIEPSDVADGDGFDTGFSKSDTKYNKAFVNEIMLGMSGVNYVFVSLGEDKLNLSVARAFADVASKLGTECTVACACADGKARRGIYPVNVRAKASENENYAQIERMAFNAHLAWTSPLKLNVDIKTARQEFGEKYNHDSSVACIISIKSYLYACGIDADVIDDASVLETANAYSAYIKKNKDVFAKLVNVEHRRWIVEKITDGWRRKTDLGDVLSQPVNDKRKKLHPCIVKSSAEFGLEKKYKTKSGKWDREKWNKPCGDDNSLDQLDMLSLKLHRVFFDAAQEIRESYSLNGEESRRIMWLIGDSRDAVIAFNEWMLCLAHIWNADEAHTRFYEGYKEDFVETLKVFTKSERDEIMRYVNIIDSKAYPLIMAFRMRDYKASDKDIINAIPFILTHREDYKLFIPLMTGDNTSRFDSVASVTIINPETVTYGVYLREQDDVQEVTDTVKHILSYMDKKDIKARLKFLLIYNARDVRLARAMGDLTAALRDADSRVRRVNAYPVSDEADIAALVRDSVSADAYEKNADYLSALLMGAGFYNGRPSYSFDSAAKRFMPSAECSWLNFIKSGQFITVSDMLSFKNSTGVMETLPEYAEYKKLWGIYTDASYAWKDMCNLLDRYSEKNDVIASFKSGVDLSQTKMLEYVVPNELRESYNRIITYLRDEAGVIGDDSAVLYRSVESCLVVIEVSQENTDAVKRLFVNPYLMTNEKDISIVAKPRKIEIIHDSLVVGGVDFADYPEFSDKKRRIGDILTSLEGCKYIYNLKKNADGGFSFVYSTRQAKQLMTSAGRILEIYVYHKLQESGFDDVVSGFEISWGDSDVKSEFDCIVTSGFRCAVIECKAQDKLTQDYYYKLSCLVKQFGINAVPILIADTHERDGHDNSINQMQRDRGKMMGVVTIFERNEISNIDMTLRSIFNGKYDDSERK